jgi:2-polyprenyl-3-methyl-5-hydroxy-6-metoxy-1,4-benzoquinol methylase
MTITQIAPLGYDTKSAAYFEEVRPEMMPFVPAGCRRLLDVGCGAGGFGESLKRSRKIEVWGVEPIESAAEQATTKLDRVFHGTFDAEAGLPAGTFDCVMFNDVLEHMVAPEKALSYARTLLAPGGAVVASIPNIRSFPTMWQLMFHASWEYTDYGVLDKTHLRFFTRSSIVNFFEREGYAVKTIRGINAHCGVPNTSTRLWTAYRLANVLFMRKFEDMKFQQFAVVAKPSPERARLEQR